MAPSQQIALIAKEDQHAFREQIKGMVLDLNACDVKLGLATTHQKLVMTEFNLKFMYTTFNEHYMDNKCRLHKAGQMQFVVVYTEVAGTSSEIIASATDEKKHCKKDSSGKCKMVC